MMFSGYLKAFGLQVFIFFSSSYKPRQFESCLGLVDFTFFFSVTCTGKSPLNFNLLPIADSVCNKASTSCSRTGNLFFWSRLNFTHFSSESPFLLQNMPGSLFCSSPVLIAVADGNKHLKG